MSTLPVPAGPTATLPLWARPPGVVSFCVLWAGAFAFLAIVLRSNIVTDDAIEIYNTQSLQLFYASRNPALYDWLLIGLDTVVRNPAVSAPMLNYALMLACALLFYALARRVIEDGRLQALSVYSLPLLSVMGYDSHHQITHTNVTIVMIAATLLTLHSLARRRSLPAYAALGVLIALGLMSKYAYALFAVALLLAALPERRYRAVVLDRRFLVSLVIGVAPLVALAVLFREQAQSVASTVDGVVEGTRQASLSARLELLGVESLTYLMPFAAVFAVVFLLPFPPRREGGGRDGDFMRLNLSVFLVGAAVMAIWVLGMGSLQLRARYLHGIWLAAPLAAFMALERRVPRPSAKPIYLAVAAGITTCVFGILLAGCLAPARALCDSCDQSIPYKQLGREIEARYGPSPTLVGLRVVDAGRLRGVVPGARALSLQPAEYRPPARAGDTCLLVWSADEGREPWMAAVLAEQGMTLSPDQEIVLDWWGPLLAGGRQTTFRIQRLPPASPVCA